MRAVAQLSVHAALDFLAEQEQRLSPKTFGNYADVVYLLESHLNGYAYDSLEPDEAERWEQAFEGGDEDAYCNVFGPEKLTEHLGAFLNWFMLRKVFASQELLKASATVTKKLVGWLAERELIGAAEAAEVTAMAREAGRDVPASDRLTRLLGEMAPDRFSLAPPEPIDDGVVQDLLTITRVEPGKLWFDDGIGPLEVSREASDLAKPGWSLFATLAPSKGRWRLLEHGIVYP